MAKIGTYPSASTLGGTEELIGVQSSASVKLTPEQLREYDDSQKVTGDVNISLNAAGGGDFTTLADLIEWIQTTEFYGATLYVTVNAGTYTVPDSTSYAIKKDGINELRMNGTNKATSIIEVDDNAAGKYYAFRLDGMDSRWTNLTFNSIAATEPYLLELYGGETAFVSCDFTGFDCLAYVYGGVLYLSGVTITSAPGTYDSVISAYNNSFVYMNAVACDNNNAGWIAYECLGGSRMQIHGTCSISNSDGGIDVYDRSFVDISGTINFINITSYEYNIPLNEMQSNGSYISDENLEVNLATRFKGQNLQTGTAYTLVLGDAGHIVEMNNGAANTLTIPSNAAVAFPVDTYITVIQYGAGQTTIAIDTDTLTGNVNINAQYEAVTLWKRSATEWVVLGGVA